MHTYLLFFSVALSFKLALLNIFFYSYFLFSFGPRIFGGINYPTFSHPFDLQYSEVVAYKILQISSFECKIRSRTSSKCICSEFYLNSFDLVYNQNVRNCEMEPRHNVCSEKQKTYTTHSHLML